jgi:hypothetical protein
VVTRQMIQVVGLAEPHGHERLHPAVECALALGCSDAAAIAHVVTAADLIHARTEIIEAGDLSRLELQQLRKTIFCDQGYRFIIHDHDSMFSAALGVSLTRLGLKVIATPVHSLQANSLCERLIGTL